MSILTLEFNRSNDFHIHDWLQNNTLRHLECLTESTDGCKSESQFRRIDGMEGTILEHETASENGVTG